MVRPPAATPHEEAAARKGLPLSKPGMDVREGPLPCVNKGGTEVKYPRAADI